MQLETRFCALISYFYNKVLNIFNETKQDEKFKYNFVLYFVLKLKILLQKRNVSHPLCQILYCNSGDHFTVHHENRYWRTIPKSISTASVFYEANLLFVL